MTDTPPPHPAAPVPREILAPGVTTVLFALSIALLPHGCFVLLGTSSRGFFAGAALQASIGTAMLAAGFCCALCTLVLVGVRGIVQQQTDILLRAEREGIR